MRSLNYFLFNAVYSWILELGETPMAIVDLTNPNVLVPASMRSQYGEKVTLNLSMTATHQMQFNDSTVNCGIAFNQRRCNIEIPYDAIIALFCKESQRIMGFPRDPRFDTASSVVQQQPQQAPTTAAEPPAESVQTNRSALPSWDSNVVSLFDRRRK